MPVTMDTQQQNFWVESINKEAAVRFAWQMRYSKNFNKTGGTVAATSQATTKKKQEEISAATNAFTSNLSAKIQQLEEEGKKLAQDKRDSSFNLSQRSSRRSSSQPSRRQGSAVIKTLTEGGGTILSDMRPASVNTKSLLYNGISAHGEGRYAYLKKRSHLPPETKYEFPVLSSNLHGWKIMEYTGSEPQHSPYGRTCIIRDTFYRNSGITLT